MELTPDEVNTQNEACSFMSDNQDRLIDEFILAKKPAKIDFMTIFTAGGPGAGKTEFVTNFIPLIYSKQDKNIINILQKQGVSMDFENLFIHIDVDKIRDFLPQYKKTDSTLGVKANAHVVQKAANMGLDTLREYCFENQLSFIHDGTFSNYKTMKKLIEKSLSRGRVVDIYYIYIDPIRAWDFTKAREIVERRNILKEKFVQQFFDAQKNVQKIKELFNEKVRLHCVLKNEQGQLVDIKFNYPSVDVFLKEHYSNGILKKYHEKDLLSWLS